MRSDLEGMFWQDLLTGRERTKRQRPMPPIPDTGWLPPTEFPDLSRARALVVDVETKDPELRPKQKSNRGPGWARGVGHLVGVSIGTNDGYRRYFPFRHEVEPEHNLDPAQVLAWLRHTLADPRQPKIGANLTYDVGWLAQEGVQVAGELYDVQFAEALINEHLTVNLDDLGMRYLGEHKSAAVLYEWCSQFYGGPATGRQRANIYRTPPRLVGPYAEGDVDLPIRVLERQWPQLAAQGLLDLFHMECELIPLVVAMRFAGVAVDLDYAEQLKVQLTGEINSGQAYLERQLGFPIDIWSSESLAKAFDSQGLTYPLTEKTHAPSFKGGFLDLIDHPLAKGLTWLRERDKLRNTFVQSYILDSAINGFVYGQFHQLKDDSNGAGTGRWASSTPNLQNIPTRTALGKLLRRIFKPDIGHASWRKYDYSQIEYRFLAHYAVGQLSDYVRQLYANDPRTDFHELVKSIILQKTGQELDRDRTKRVNFGVVYGMGEDKLTRDLGLTKAQGKELFGVIHEGAPFMKATAEATSNEAKHLGYVTTILGRRVRFNLWEPLKYDKEAIALPYELAVTAWPQGVRRAYLHKALNARLQGSGTGDLPKAAMLRCWKDGVFARTGVPRLVVHDELDFSDPGGRDDAFREMQHIMETAIAIRVPIRVGLEVGPNWGEVKKVAQ